MQSDYKKESTLRNQDNRENRRAFNEDQERLSNKLKECHNNILSNDTKKKRRSLLAVSVVSIVIVMGKILPTKISALGIELSVKNHEDFLLMIKLILVYFLFNYLFYLWRDVNFNKSNIKAYWYHQSRLSQFRRKRKDLKDLKKSMKKKSTDQISQEDSNRKEELEKEYPFRKYASSLFKDIPIFFYYINEFIFPIFMAGIALIMLWNFTLPNPTL
jgi:hypothetical protein